MYSYLLFIIRDTLKNANLTIHPNLLLNLLLYIRSCVVNYIRPCLSLISVFIILLCLHSTKLIAAPQSVMLAHVYDESIKIQDYWISEKYDGIRAYWDGKHFWSRNGRLIHAPDYFLAGLPNIALDGELWLARKQFEQTSSILLSEQDKGWHKIQFMVFDLPQHKGIFDERLIQLKSIVNNTESPYLTLVPQFKVESHQVLMQLLKSYVDKGAEGLMLHLGQSYYQAKRSHNLLKLKQFKDAEATVIGYTQGKGKYSGKVGALVVKTHLGVQFKVGSGLSDKDRENPPAIGAIISYKYFELTKNGKPRFPVFLRVRLDSHF